MGAIAPSEGRSAWGWGSELRRVLHELGPGDVFALAPVVVTLRLEALAHRDMLVDCLGGIPDAGADRREGGGSRRGGVHRPSLDGYAGRVGLHLKEQVAAGEAAVDAEHLDLDRLADGGD